jgi:hypothetical protein
MSSPPISRSDIPTFITRAAFLTSRNGICMATPYSSPFCFLSLKTIALLVLMCLNTVKTWSSASMLFVGIVETTFEWDGQMLICRALSDYRFRL